MSRLTRDGTAEPASRDQILRHERGQGNILFPCSAEYEQDWQPYPVDAYSVVCDDHRFGDEQQSTVCQIHKLVFYRVVNPVQTCFT